MATWLFMVLVTAAPPSEAAPRVADPVSQPAVVAPGASPAVRTAGRTPKELRDHVHKTLRAAAIESGAQREAAIRRLTGLYKELSRDTQLPLEDRLVLARTIRARLLKVKEQIVRTGHGGSLAGTRSDKAAGAAVDKMPAAGNTASARSTLASAESAAAASPAAGRGGGAAADDGEALVDLIEQTIAPETWDINGGPGTIRYYSTWHALVVRQTDEVHDLVRGVVEGLRD